MLDSIMQEEGAHRWEPPTIPEPVKLVASLLTGEPELLAQVKEALSQELGPIDLESELLPFDHTSYYTPEFGSGLQRQIVTFEKLVDPGGCRKSSAGPTTWRARWPGTENGG